MNKVCSKCGASVPADQKFCTNCGSAEFKTEEVAAPVAPVTPVTPEAPAPAEPVVAPVTPEAPVAPVDAVPAPGAPVQPGVAPVAAPKPPKKGMPTWAKVLIIIGVILLLIGGCTAGCIYAVGKGIVDLGNEIIDTSNEYIESELEEYEDYDYDDEEEEEVPTEYSNSSLAAWDGEEFEFDDLDFTLSTEVEVFTMNDTSSAYFGKDIVKVPVKLENNSGIKNGINMFYFEFTDPNGSKTSTIAPEMDDNIDYSPDFYDGQTVYGAFYFVYTVDGTYTIDFDNFSEQVTVKVEVAK